SREAASRSANFALSICLTSFATRSASTLTGFKWSFRNGMESFGAAAKARIARVEVASSVLARSAQALSRPAGGVCPTDAVAKPRTNSTVLKQWVNRMCFILASGEIALIGNALQLRRCRPQAADR